MQRKTAISVAGSHGKTTTSAMIAHALMKLGKDPSFAVGCGEILSLKTSGHAGKGEYFVAEADEYVTDPISDPTPRFMWQEPEVLVITNVDFDHPDVYTNLSQVQEAFVKFTQKIKPGGCLIANGDNPSTVEILKRVNAKVITYGKSKSADYRLSSLTINNRRSAFEIKYKESGLGSYNLRIPGEHNVLNATAAVSALHQLGLDPKTFAQHLTSFAGTKRRFELVGEKNGKVLYDDYAHHPKEIEATIQAARSWFPNKRLTVIFQPHTYSRTQALLPGFAQSLSLADQVVVTEIYASAREQPIAGVNGELLLRTIKEVKTEAQFAPNRDSVLQYLDSHTQTGDLIMTMGAGDIYSWLPQILDTL